MYFHILFDLEPIAVVFYEAFHTAFRKTPFANSFHDLSCKYMKDGMPALSSLALSVLACTSHAERPGAVGATLPKPLWTDGCAKGYKSNHKKAYVTYK